MHKNMYVTGQLFASCQTLSFIITRDFTSQIESLFFIVVWCWNASIEYFLKLTHVGLRHMYFILMAYKISFSEKWAASW